VAVAEEVAEQEALAALAANLIQAMFLFVVEPVAPLLFQEQVEEVEEF
jgi:hypothetical protein